MLVAVLQKITRQLYVTNQRVADELTKAERAGKASDDSNGIFWVSAKLEKNRREGIPFALQLHKIHFK